MSAESDTAPNIAARAVRAVSLYGPEKIRARVPQMPVAAITKPSSVKLAIVRIRVRITPPCVHEVGRSGHRREPWPNEAAISSIFLLFQQVHISVAVIFSSCPHAFSRPDDRGDALSIGEHFQRQEYAARFLGFVGLLPVFYTDQVKVRSPLSLM